MTYYYNGSKIQTPYTITSNEPIWSTTTVSMKEIRASQNAQRWELDFEIITKEASTIFLQGIKELKTTSTMVMPQFPEVVENTTAIGSMFANSINSAGATAITVDTSGATGTLSDGSFIKFDNHSKVYLVDGDVSLFGSSATINIYPGLRAPLALTDSVKFGDDCVISYKKDISSLSGITFNSGVLVSPGNVRLIEAV
jgi:hypothetical protein